MRGKPAVANSRLSCLLSCICSVVHLQVSSRAQFLAGKYHQSSGKCSELATDPCSFSPSILRFYGVYVTFHHCFSPFWMRDPGMPRDHVALSPGLITVTCPDCDLIPLRLMSGQL